MGAKLICKIIENNTIWTQNETLQTAFEKYSDFVDFQKFWEKNIIKLLNWKERRLK